MPFNPTFGGHSWTKTVLLRDAIVCQRHEKLIIETRCHVCVVMHNHTTELRNLPTGREEQNHFTPLSKEETPGSELPAQGGNPSRLGATCPGRKRSRLEAIAQGGILGLALPMPLVGRD